MSFSHKALPIREAPPQAGGGQSSAIADHQTVKQLAPSTYGNLESLYKTLVSNNKPEPTPSDDGPPLASFEAFQAWFQLPDATALAPLPPVDLSFPISNYYISSSHNTYLSGNQLYGSSSVAAYINVLLRGCRCLEIDVWDADDDLSSASSSDAEQTKIKPDAESRTKRASSKLSSLKSKWKEEIKSQRSPPPSSQAAAADQEAAAQAIELNSYPFEPSMKLEPRVYHGYTLVKGIPFRLVCRAIKDSAFKASTLPVIVSLEVHANLDQQKIMVDIMAQEWKGFLVDISESSLSQIDKLPSPDALRNKILIKVKWAPHSQTGESNDPVEQVQSQESNTGKPGQAATPEAKKKAVKVIEALSKLGVYTRAYTFKQFDQPEAKIPTHVFSLEENKLQSLHSDSEHGPALFKHNRDFLMRVFPSGLRVDSSNIDPTFGWRQGAQMVALNWQKIDKGTMLNEGMFAGGEGWVLKPEGFRNTAISQSKPRHEFLNLTIKLIAGQSIPLPPDKEESYLPHMRPYVTVQLHVDTHGPPGQGKSSSSDSAGITSKYGWKKSRTDSDGEEDGDNDADARKLKRKSYHAKSSNPSFQTEVMSWTDVPDVVEMLSFVRIKVKDDKRLAKDDLIAWACIRLDRLKTGYRFIHLLDVNGKPTDGVLLVKIEKTLR